MRCNGTLGFVLFVLFARILTQTPFALVSPPPPRAVCALRSPLTHPCVALSEIDMHSGALHFVFKVCVLTAVGGKVLDEHVCVRTFLESVVFMMPRVIPR